jgi:hypothetical protein
VYDGGTIEETHIVLSHSSEDATSMVRVCSNVFPSMSSVQK